MGIIAERSRRVQSDPYRIAVAPAERRGDPIFYQVVRSCDGRALATFRQYDDAETLCDRLLERDVEPGEELDDVLPADREWWARVSHSEWWADLATETVSDAYGEAPPAGWLDDSAERVELDSEWEVERYLSARSGSIQVDAEEEARMLGWA